MNSDELELTRFIVGLHQEIITNSEGSSSEGNEGAFREDEFTRIMIDYLIDAGEIDDGSVCYHNARGIKVNGYNLQVDEGRLDLFVSIYNQTPTPLTVRKDVTDNAFKQLINFLSKVYKGYHQQIEEASITFLVLHRFE
jgi:hypothetical protein